ncbi:MAG: hypothetical protein CM15mP42_11110 [Methanobacteriota archaeon]|nr:MAG: hypothetical protein CM15mP42_11110 [Euryarchaeota archaeon]
MDRAPPVVDSKDILLDPRETLRLLCEKLGVVFSEEMLSWSKGVLIRTEYGQNIGMIMSLIQRVSTLTQKKMNYSMMNIFSCMKIV